MAQVRCYNCDAVAPPGGISQPESRDAAQRDSSRRQARLRDDHEASLKDADELMKLAAAVKAAHDTRDRHSPDVSTVKQLNEMERIAKRIRGRLKRM